MGFGGLLRALLGNRLVLTGYCLRFWVMADSLLKEKLQSFIECEGKSCSFDPELITPEYVYRMWGGSVAIDEIATGLTELRKNGFLNISIG